MALPATYIALLEAFLASNAGVTKIRHPDGREITLDRKQALTELQYWESRQARDASPGLRMARVNCKGDA
ncbi:MAG: hypothetical protein WC329_05790 [Candidatus Omnitrophota bacterium]|jgi:hypothetical protein